MANTLNTDILIGVLEKPNFNNLTPDQKDIVLGSIGSKNEKGVLDKMFGDNSERLPIYIAFLICIFLIVISTIFTCASYFTGKSIDLGLWGEIIPVITLALGYMFGKNEKNKG